MTLTLGAGPLHARIQVSSFHHLLVSAIMLTSNQGSWKHEVIICSLICAYTTWIHDGYYVSDKGTCYPTTLLHPQGLTLSE
jgi:hypothetical protein